MASVIIELAPFMIALVITGMISGFVAGLLGVGGGIVIVPILSYLLVAADIHSATPMHVAIASSLAVIVPTSMISAWTHFKLGNIDKSVIVKMAPFIFLGASGGAIVADYLDNSSLKVAFGMMAVMVAFVFFSKPLILRDNLPSFAPRGVIGFFIGQISALLGIGGGSLMVPFLVACHFDMRKAVGTSSLIGLVIAVPGVISFMVVGQGAVSDLPYAVGYVWLPAFVIIAGAAYLTAPIGARFVAKLDKDLLRKIFGLFLLIVGGRLVYSGIMAGGLAFITG